MTEWKTVQHPCLSEQREVHSSAQCLLTPLTWQTQEQKLKESQFYEQTINKTKIKKTSYKAEFKKINLYCNMGTSRLKMIHVQKSRTKVPHWEPVKEKFTINKCVFDKKLMMNKINPIEEVQRVLEPNYSAAHASVKPCDLAYLLALAPPLLRLK